LLIAFTACIDSGECFENDSGFRGRRFNRKRQSKPS
jgi:hypothetical protein